MRRFPALRPRAVRRQTRLRVRAVLLLGLLVPFVGIVSLAGILVNHRWSDRQASTRLEAETAELKTTLELVAAVTHEQSASMMLGLANDFDLPPERLGIDPSMASARLRGARSVVDASRLADVRATVDAFERLDELRAQLDAGTPGYAEVVDVFHRLNDQLAAQWQSQMTEIDRVADSQPLSSEMRHQLRTLRESMGVLALADDRIHEALQILLGSRSAEDVETLVALTAEFHTSLERGRPDPGTEAAERWEQFRTDPAAQRTENTIASAVQIGLGARPPAEIADLSAVSRALTDGARWGDLLADVVTASARDLRSTSAAHAEADTRAVATATILAGLLGLASFGLALAIARQVSRPAHDLEDAARRVALGEFDIPTIEPHGPRELRATVDAFNDMAATLAAVEGHAVALAEDPRASVLNDPLPGRTGRAMQVALDRLLGSIREAERQRVALADLAIHDGLTGLLNQTAAIDAVDRELAQAHRDGADLLALYIDLDRLKYLNDNHGHAAGDEAIRRTADALRSTTRDGDITARLGGDEFLIVCRTPAGGRTTAEEFAERVRAAVGAQAIDLDGDGTFGLECSVGIAMTSFDITSAHDLIRAADGALYQAKHGGRGRTAWESSDMVVVQDR